MERGGEERWREENKLLKWTEIFSEASWAFGHLNEKEISKHNGLIVLEVTDPQYITTWRFTEEIAASQAKWDDAFLTLQQEYGSLMQLENTMRVQLSFTECDLHTAVIYRITVL